MDSEGPTLARLRRAALAWPGVEEGPHRFGGSEFKLEGREIGHAHGDRFVDIPFRRAVRDEVIAAGLAQPHHALPDSGWVTIRTDQPDGAEKAITLLRRSYDAIASRVEARHGREGAGPAAEQGGVP